METAYREMQFETMGMRIRLALDSLKRAQDGIERQDAAYVMMQCEFAKKNAGLASFHADHVLLVAEQEDTILQEGESDGRTNPSDQAPR
jgi:hypothetical protein